MSSKMTNTAEDQIADYLNGHLAEEQAREFEQQLAADAQLREMVAFEKRVKRHLLTTETVSEAQGPRFASFEARLDKGKRQFNMPWLNWGLPAALALVLGVVGYVQTPQTGPSTHSTLSDPPVLVEEPMLRLISYKNLDRQQMDELLREYNLVLVKEHHGLSSYDVKPMHEASLDELATILAGDPRIRFANVQGGH